MKIGENINIGTPVIYAIATRDVRRVACSRICKKISKSL